MELDISIALDYHKTQPSLTGLIGRFYCWNMKRKITPVTAGDKAKGQTSRIR